MITNEQLDERADELTSLFEMAGYGTFTTDPLRIYRNLTRNELESGSEVLYLLEEALPVMKNYAPEDQSVIIRIESHISKLRRKLGVPQ